MLEYRTAVLLQQDRQRRFAREAKIDHRKRKPAAATRFVRRAKDEEGESEPATAGHRSHFVRHFLGMILAMALGMMILGGLVYGAMSLAGVDTSRISPELDTLLMVLNMSIGMTVWMRHRGHDWLGILEMDGAMVAAVLVLFPLLWTDAISVDAMYGLAHGLMLPVMLVVMLRRRHQYGLA